MIVVVVVIAVGTQYLGIRTRNRETYLLRRRARRRRVESRGANERQPARESVMKRQKRISGENKGTAGGFEGRLRRRNKWWSRLLVRLKVAELEEEEKKEVEEGNIWIEGKLRIKLRYWNIRWYIDNNRPTLDRLVLQVTEMDGNWNRRMRHENHSKKQKTKTVKSIYI